MSLTATDSGTDFKSVDPGTYPARCYRLVDLGHQAGSYMNIPNVKHQILIGFELPSELIEEGEYSGKPYPMAKFFTLSLHEKANLRKTLESWRNKSFTEDELKGFDLRKILGAPAMITVIKNDKGKTVISSITSVVKGMTVPKAINPIFDYDIEKDGFGEKFDSLTDGIKKIIMNSEEYTHKEGVPTEQYTDAQEDSGIPF
jgi:hypothetical protein